MDIKRTRNKRWEVDRIEQCALGRILIKDLTRLHKQRIGDRLTWTRIVYKDASPRSKLQRRKSMRLYEDHMFMARELTSKSL